MSEEMVALNGMLSKKDAQGLTLREELHQITLTTTAFAPEAIHNMFTYHPPTEEAIGRHRQVEESFRALAHKLNEVLPNCQETRLAIRDLQRARGFANMAIAINISNWEFHNLANQNKAEKPDSEQPDGGE